MSVTVRLVDGPAATVRALRLAPEGAIEDTAISRVFQASQAGHWPCPLGGVCATITADVTGFWTCHCGLPWTLS